MVVTKAEVKYILIFLVFAEWPFFYEKKLPKFLLLRFLGKDVKRVDSGMAEKVQMWQIYLQQNTFLALRNRFSSNLVSEKKQNFLSAQNMVEHSY